MTDAPLQTWTQTLAGHAHRVEVRGSVMRHVQWWVDDELVGEKKSMEDKLRVAPTDPDAGHGTMNLRFSGLGKPRRATLTAPGELLGTDLEPAAGSPAAAYEEKVRAHPRRHELVATLGGVATVIVPIVVATLLARLAFSIPWPDLGLPAIPWPDLPSIPWPDLPDLPDLPSIPWPDVSVPAWVGEVLDKAKYVWPVVLAWVLARAEIKRRRSQDELRQSTREAGEAGRAGEE